MTDFFGAGLNAERETQQGNNAVDAAKEVRRLSSSSASRPASLFACLVTAMSTFRTLGCEAWLVCFISVPLLAIRRLLAFCYFSFG